MMPSNGALTKLLAKYEALASDARFTLYGYWRITFSVAPGIDMYVMVCDNTVTRDEAIDLAIPVLASRTGQKVRKP